MLDVFFPPHFKPDTLDFGGYYEYAMRPRNLRKAY